MSPSIRAFFHWKYSGVLIPFFWGVGGLGMIQLAHAVPRPNWAFLLSYAFFALGAIWTAGYWLTSDYLDSKHGVQSTLIGPDGRRLPSLFSQHRYRIWKWSVFVAIVAVLTLFVILTHILQIENELVKPVGILVPDNIPDDPLTCRGSPGFKLYCGTVVDLVDSFPHTVFRVQADKVLTIDKDSLGNVVITFKVFDRDGKLVASIERNVFRINSTNVAEMRRPDKSTLIVRDEWDQEVLNIHYMNKNAMTLTTVIRYPGEEPFVISPNTVRQDGVIYSNFCLVPNHAGAFAGRGNPITPQPKDIVR